MWKPDPYPLGPSANLLPTLLSGWGGSRASAEALNLRRLWPSELPNDFTVDLELLLHRTKP